MANEPEVLLMERFAALDAQTKEQLQQFLLEIWQKTRKMLTITHDVEEAVFLSERIYLMSAFARRIQSEIMVELPLSRDFKI